MFTHFFQSQKRRVVCISEFSHIRTCYLLSSFAFIYVLYLNVIILIVPLKRETSVYITCGRSWKMLCTLYPRLKHPGHKLTLSTEPMWYVNIQSSAGTSHDSLQIRNWMTADTHSRKTKKMKKKVGRKSWDRGRRGKGKMNIRWEKGRALT